MNGCEHDGLAVDIITRNERPTGVELELDIECPGCETALYGYVDLGVYDQ
jgi:hypothetical protein